MSDETTLLPCPFCGGEAEIRTQAFGGVVFFAWCDSCETRGDYYCTEAEAIAAWNTRHVETCELSVCGWDNDTIQCMACGAYWEHQQFDIPSYYPIEFCPSCGRKVVKA